MKHSGVPLSSTAIMVQAVKSIDMPTTSDASTPDSRRTSLTVKLSVSR